MYTKNGEEFKSLLKTKDNYRYASELQSKYRNNNDIFDALTIKNKNDNINKKINTIRRKMKEKYTKDYVEKSEKNLRNLMSQMTKQAYDNKVYIKQKNVSMEESENGHYNHSVMNKLRKKFNENHGENGVQKYKMHSNAEKFLQKFKDDKLKAKNDKLLLLYNRLQFQRNMYKKMQNNAAIKAYSSKFRS